MHLATRADAEAIDKTARKRISYLISTLSSPNSLKRLLGPYRNLPLCNFDELSLGSNKGAVCCGGVVTSLPADSDLNLNLLLADAKGTLLVLRIFQIAKVGKLLLFGICL